MSPHRLRAATRIALLSVAIATAGCGAGSSSSSHAQAPSSDDSGSRMQSDIDRTAGARQFETRGRSLSVTEKRPNDNVTIEEWREIQRERRARQAPSDPEGRRRSVAASEALDRALSDSQRQALRALEAQLVAELNRARTDPAAYVAKLESLRLMYSGNELRVPGALAVRTSEGPAAVTEAIEALRSAEPIPALTRSAGLSASARGLAAQLSDEAQLAGRDDSDSLHTRMNYFGRVEGVFTENISALYREADLQLMLLMIDDGVETRVHRYNMFGPMFQAVGVGCAPHASFEVVCVMELAERFHEAEQGD
ncbi:CAP domain-containing protein [Haliangium ochraceum]|uniref:SCP-like extracellular n=1 Tax=Haliangium ochraceum (strain DSM 14365 / JCM 11303 / SMP-2) TaxID=502025 RepID=D0LWM0_HALO1|nr:CAP domain-containing protein [Haliangium ochraceum]ACY17670.1 SCP-like extracellular [Haliangium ochraceum DSM 14365]